jgi:hypothetical protein
MMIVLHHGVAELWQQHTLDSGKLHKWWTSACKFDFVTICNLCVPRLPLVEHCAPHMMLAWLLKSALFAAAVAAGWLAGWLAGAALKCRCSKPDMRYTSWPASGFNKPTIYLLLLKLLSAAAAAGTLHCRCSRPNIHLLLLLLLSIAGAAGHTEQPAHAQPSGACYQLQQTQHTLHCHTTRRATGIII